VLAVGPFYSGNWVAAHLEPLAAAQTVARVLVITPEAYTRIDHLEYLTPPGWLRRLTGMSVARAAQALVTAIRRRPDVVIGYHLPWNGVVALLAGRLAGARTLYFSVGGPAEIAGGGLYSEHALFSRQGREQPGAERGLLRLVERFDAVLTMGSDGERYLRAQGVRTPIVPVSVGVSAARFDAAGGHARADEPQYDLITVSRLARIKRVDLFLDVVARLAEQRPDVTAIIVGDGEQRAHLAAMIERLGIDKNVRLAGWCSDVGPLLMQSRLFMMTSASEGLPLSVIEAMLCGLPAIVPNVGDLADLVRDGENGHLVPPGDVDSAARAAADLLADTPRRSAFGNAARRAALRYTVAECALRWDTFFTDLDSRTTGAGHPTQPTEQ
jgi:glycosyltransferase involved in cell wall biosynthesis